mgnify:FL=1
MEVKVNVFENRKIWYNGPTEKSWRVVLLIDGRPERSWDVSTREQLFSIIENIVDTYRYTDVHIVWRVTESWA